MEDEKELEINNEEIEEAESAEVASEEVEESDIEGEIEGGESEIEEMLASGDAVEDEDTGIIFDISDLDGTGDSEGGELEGEALAEAFYAWGESGEEALEEAEISEHAVASDLGPDEAAEDLGYENRQTGEEHEDDDPVTSRLPEEFVSAPDGDGHGEIIKIEEYEQENGPMDYDAASNYDEDTFGDDFETGAYDYDGDGEDGGEDPLGESLLYWD